MTDHSTLLARLREAQARIVLDGRHRYKVDGRYGPPGVTSIDILDKPGLTNWKINQQTVGVARAAHGCPPHDGESEQDYIARLRRITAKQFEADRLSDLAAKVGSGVHALIEAWVKRKLGQTIPDPEVPEEARYRFVSWPAWAARVGLVPLASESRLYSEKHDFCGTLDLLALYENELAVIDAKPHPAVYVSRRLQLGGYRLLLSEMGWPPMRGFLNVIPRDGGDITMVEVDPPGPDLDASQEAFLHCLALYRWQADHERKHPYRKSA